ncbi:hypothetical protein PGB90_001851 [Kerria lacca]
MGEAKIQKGVRQRCFLSPIDLFIEKEFEEINERKLSVKVRGYKIKTIRL